MTGAPSAFEALARKSDLAEFGWAPEWREAPLAASTVRPACLLVFDDGSVGPVLCERLRRKGHHLVRAIAGDALELGDDECVLAPSPDAYDRLIAELVRRGRTPARVAHLWLVGPSRGPFGDRQAGLESVSHLCRALAARSIAAGVAVFTSGTLQVADEPVSHPSKALVLGAVRALPRELAGPSLRVVDLDAEPERAPRLRERVERAIANRIAPGRVDPPTEELARVVERELAAEGGGVFAYRDGVRYEERYVPLRLAEAAADELGLREGGTYVIAGGLGTIGLAIAELFAEHGRANLVLLDRDELAVDSDRTDARAAHRRAALGRIEALGSEVLVVRADVADLDDLEAAVRVARDRFGSIHGLVHAAASASPRRTRREIEDALAPKIHGTLALDRVLGDEPLDFFVLSSSASAAVGPPGASEQIAADAFLEAYARSRSGHNTYTVAIAWGPWGGERGLAPAEATGALARVLAGERRPVVAVSSIDLDAWSAALGRQPRALVRPIGESAEARSRHLVTLEDDGDGEPFFFVCFDRVAPLRPIARALRRRVYALRTRRAFHSIDALARTYVDELRVVQPKGPYLLGAVNEAGALAFETAKRLRAADEPVALLAMIDAFAPVERDVRGRVDFHLDRVRRRGVRHAAEWARARVEKEAARVRAFLDDGVAGAVQGALDRYAWSSEPGRIAFFRVASDRGTDPGWHAWTEGVDVVELRPDPGGIGSPLAARSLAARLEIAIESALSSRDRTATG